MAQGVWVLAEQRRGELQDISLELVSEGRKVADRLREELGAVLLGHQVDGLAATLGHYGADKVYLVDDESLAGYSTLTHSAVLVDLVHHYAPSTILIGATSLGRDLAPRVATRLKTGLIADCVILKAESSGELLATRPVYSEKMYATMGCPTARPLIATIRPGAMDVEDPDNSRVAEVVHVERIGLVDPLAKVVGFIKADPKTIDLTEAQLIVGGGRGVNGKQGLRLLEELAEAIGASIGGSRVLVDDGWLPYERQIGQTGKNIAPKVYIACGISGATQHMAGVKSTTTIIAINSDRSAPIFKSAEVRIVGDLHEIVPAITERIRASARVSGGKA